MEPNKRTILLVSADVLSAFIAWTVALSFSSGMNMNVENVITFGVTKVVMFVAAMVFMSFLVEIYKRHRDLSTREIAARILYSVAISFFIISPVCHAIDVPAGKLSFALVTFGLLQFLSHAVYRIVVKFRGFARKILIIGVGPLAGHMGDIIPTTDDNYVLSGYVRCPEELAHVPAETILGTTEGLFETVQREKADKIVVSLSERRGVFPFRDVMNCKLSGIEVVDAPSFYEQMTGKLLLESIRPSWFIFSEGFRITALSRVIKRIMDACCAITGIVITLPFLPLIALAIKLDSPGPILFRQTRVGENEKSFNLYKFRSMGVDAEKGTGAVWAREHDPRVTRLGSFLRKSRIDELPQLFNVLRGDMSLVGPRPERPEFVEQLKEAIPYYSERHVVKPGVTGWAQVKYQYGASVEDALEKLRYDLYYIKNISIFLDLMIIFETVKVVLFRRGGR
jgi:sugar transferase (PEP-CTERM system associated)